MSVTRQLFVVLFAVAALLACASTSAQRAAGDAIRTDVCTLIERPKEFEGQLVTVHAVAKAVTHYSMVLLDPSCGDRTIMLTIPDSTDNTEEISRLRAAVFAGYPNPPKTRTTARVTGWFKRASGAVPTRTLIATQIADVETIGVR